VAEGEVVQTFAAAFGRGAKNFAQEADTFLLFIASGSFYEALEVLLERVEVSLERRSNTQA
jgi:hypothetical protein